MKNYLFLLNSILYLISICCLAQNINLTNLIINKFYHTNDVYKFIDGLNKKKFVKVSTIGYTKQGTPLKIIHIKPDNNRTNNDTIWIDGGIFVFKLLTI